jgi:hypothetical protein
MRPAGRYFCCLCICSCGHADGEVRLAGIRELRDRVRRFEAGKWGELAAERHQFAETYRASRGSREQRQPEGVPTGAEAAARERDDEARRRQRARALPGAGELSRAVRALAVSLSAPDTEETEAELRRLHPAAEPVGIPDWVPTFAPQSEFVVEEEHLREALKTAPRQSAGGWSQWLYEHLKPISALRMMRCLLCCCRYAAL